MTPWEFSLLLPLKGVKELLCEEPFRPGFSCFSKFFPPIIESYYAHISLTRRFFAAPVVAVVCGLNGVASLQIFTYAQRRHWRLWHTSLVSLSLGGFSPSPSPSPPQNRPLRHLFFDCLQRLAAFLLPGPQKYSCLACLVFYCYFSY